MNKENVSFVAGWGEEFSNYSSFFDLHLECLLFFDVPNIQASRIRCDSKRMMEDMVEDVVSEGGEGMVARKPKSVYEHGRSQLLFKIKVSSSSFSEVWCGVVRWGEVRWGCLTLEVAGSNPAWPLFFFVLFFLFFCFLSITMSFLFSFKLYLGL